MRCRLPALLLPLTCCASVSARSDSLKPKLSKTPLCGDQIEIYRSILRSNSKDLHHPLHLAFVTMPAEPFDLGEACTRAISPAHGNGREIHRIDSAHVDGLDIALVDPELPDKILANRDSGNWSKDTRWKASKEAYNHAFNQAFPTGLYWLSEVLFDESCERAIVTHGFVCNLLCGQSETVLFQKSAEEWQRADRYSLRIF